MSIIVQGLSKVYNLQRAVDAITFTINKGEIVGFLGPNGAGKSTTMKILTGYLPATSGNAIINGYDVNKQLDRVRSAIGYLPEHNPLYIEMYVREYLEFVGRVHKIKNLAKRIDEMIQLTGLTVECKKKIGQLSKGYRQRVGLAQAMLHDPSILILDEPTTGLDPNQLVEIRQVIKNIGREKTVMLSTHIMQEVEAICDRIIIINKGKIVADDTTQVIKNDAIKQRVFIVEVNTSQAEAILQSIPHVSIKKVAESKWMIISQDQRDLRPIIFNLIVKNNLTLLSMSEQEGKLEDIFKTLTQ